VERLEDRLAPALGYRIVDLNGNGLPDLEILGDSRRQIVRVVDDPASNRTWISFDKNGDGDFADRGEVRDELLTTTFDVIQVRLKAGRDVFEYHLVSGLSAGQRSLVILTGAGRDEVTLRLAGAVEAEAAFQATVWLGAGDDRFHGNLVINSFGTAGRTELQVHGGKGRDYIMLTRGLPSGADSSTPLNPAEVAGQLILGLYGDAGRDRIQVDFAVAGGFRLAEAGQLRLRVEGGTSHDSLLVSLRNTADSQGRYHLLLHGDRGNDLLSFGLFDESDGGVHFDNDGATLDGGRGRGDSGLLAPGQNAPVLRLGLEN
jgi:hypothetical protein